MITESSASLFNFDSIESTSVYFNNIICRNTSPVTVENLDPKVLDDFNHSVALAFPDNSELAIRRLRYVAPYIIQNINWDRYSAPIGDIHLKYYYQRERFLKKTGLDFNRFIEHEPIQQAIRNLGLLQEPVFEFILFLRYYYSLRSDLRYSCIEQFDAVITELDNAPQDAGVTMDVNVSGKHFKINNPDFVRRLLESVDRSQLKDDSFINEFNQGANRDRIRALDYYLVKTLLDYLPTDKSLRRGGRFSQAERNFGLSVLNLCGRLPDIDREGECGPDNNATFDKLMRDFNRSPIPFAMELFL